MMDSFDAFREWQKVGRLQAITSGLAKLPDRARFRKSYNLILFLPEHKYVGRQLDKIIGWNKVKHSYVCKNLYTGEIRNVDMERCEASYSRVID